MKVELLAPAKDVSIARSAILSGADAIYIGGNGFGARIGASNDISDIADLVKFAHSYNAKVYMTMNTLLFDNELVEARKQAVEAFNVGVDALIVQDMAYLEMGLEIELHASTQTVNFTADRVKFLEQAGFARVVLERGLSLNEIIEIRKQTNVELEAFIHGAICVGYSGQCYFSKAVTGRSGNRGECAQLCRGEYDLIDGKGVLIAKNESLLSVGDMCLGGSIKQLIDAGVCSLKIEGRLKNESYVVNNVAYYNQILNDLGVERVASGVSDASFDPNPTKSFLRKPTRYFFDDKRNLVSAPTRSLGELVGIVERIAQGSMILQNGNKINNGDGICWMNDERMFGTNVNKVESDRVFANNLESLRVGVEVFRNLDIKFNPTYKDVERRIDVDITIDQNIVTAVDVNGFQSQIDLPVGEIAKNADRARESLIGGFSKSGDTIFSVKSVNIMESQITFLPSSEINRLRRELLQNLTEERLRRYARRERTTTPQQSTETINLEPAASYLTNVSNEASKTFYRRFGVINFEQCLDIDKDFTGKELLRSRYCVRRERGICPKTTNGGTKENAESLYIVNNGKRFELRFECDRCEMVILPSS